MFEIRMQHPAKNALDGELIAWLSERLDEADGRPLLLTGSDGAFSAGLNLKKMVELEGERLRSFLDALDELCARLYLWPAPTVAFLNGHAIAGGCVLTTCCDHRIALADPRLRIGLNEVALGVCFPPRILAILRDRLSRERAQRLLLGADLFGVDEALRLGLLDEVVAGADEALARARARLETLASHPLRAYAATKRSLRAAAAEADPAARRRFLDEDLATWTASGTRERMLAVLRR